jgi:hypothetical protein
MKDLGLLHYFLGLEIWQRDGEIFVSQGKYAREILGKFHMEVANPWILLFQETGGKRMLLLER